MDTGTMAPPVMVNNHEGRGGGGGGGVGPVIGVLAVIGVLGILAGLVGRLCSGRRIMGYGPSIDVEAWLESECSSCLDGHVGGGGGGGPRFPHPHLLAATPMPAMEAAAATVPAFRPPQPPQVVPSHPHSRKSADQLHHHHSDDDESDLSDHPPQEHHRQQPPHRPD